MLVDGIKYCKTCGAELIPCYCLDCGCKVDCDKNCIIVSHLSYCIDCALKPIESMKDFESVLDHGYYCLSCGEEVLCDKTIIIGKVSYCCNCASVKIKQLKKKEVTVVIGGMA